MFSTFSGLPRTAWIIFAGTVVNRLGYVVTPFLVFYLSSRGISTVRISYVLGALGVGNLIGPIAGGLLADRVGRRWTMMAGLIGNAGALGLLFAAPNLVTLALAAIFLSAAGTMVSPAAGALLADTIETARRRAAFSLVHWAVNIGTAVAGMVGGFLAAHGYWPLFALDAATSLAYAAIAATLLHDERASRVSPDAGKGGGYSLVFADPLMRALLPLLYVALVIYTLTEVALPLAIRDHGLPTTTLGLMATLNAVVVIMLQPVATNALARFRQVPVYVTGSILVAVGIALTGLAQNTWSYAATVVLWSIGEAIIGGIPAAIISRLAPDHARGRYQGSFQWTWGIARFTTLAVGTTVYAAIGPAVIWWFSAIAGVAAALAFGALSRAIARRTPAPQPVVASAAGQAAQTLAVPANGGRVSGSRQT